MPNFTPYFAVATPLLFGLAGCAVTATETFAAETSHVQESAIKPSPSLKDNSLLSFNAASASEFRLRFKGVSKTDGSGDLPHPWSGNLWDPNSAGEFVLEEKGSGVTALALRNLDGKGAIQFYNWQATPLPAGKRYRVVCEYRGRGAGALKVGGEGIAQKDISLSDTGGAWKTLEVTLEQDAPGRLNLIVQNYAVGAENTLYLRSLRVHDVGTLSVPVVSPPPNEAGIVTENATSSLPELKPAAVADPYLRKIIAELTEMRLRPRGLLLSGENPDVLAARFQRNSVEGRASYSEEPVTNQWFKKAIRVNTERKPQEWMTHLQLFTRERIRRGDVLYVTAWVRALKVTDGKADGQGRLYASEERGGNQNASSSLYNGDFAVPRAWTRIHFPMTATRDHDNGDELKLMFTFGHTTQVIEIGGLAGVNLGPGVDKAALPHATLRLEYAGREAGAPWRKAALARIEKHRKSNLTVKVVDARGNPVPNAKVTIEMTRHAFLFGSSLPAGMLPGQNVKPWNEDFQRTAGAPEEDKKRLQKEFLRLFNAATTSVTWTVWEGGDLRISQQDILAGLKWLHANGIACLDSQAVYPSPEFTPEAARKLMKKETAAQFAEALNRFIDFSARELPVDSLQIANEIEGRPQYTDVLGTDAVAGWFKRARQANPKKPVMINGPYRLGEGAIQTRGRGMSWPSLTSEGLQYYFDLISYLKRQKAPMDYIGFQNHSGIGGPGPEAVLKTLDQFSVFGSPLQVTEFEVTLQDGNDPAQRKYQADYLRDFFTAVFSHPAARGILLQDFWQPGAWQYEGASAFFNKDWSINPHEKEYEKLVLNQWWTRVSGKSSAKGIYATRGFLGDYRVTVATPDSRTRKVKATLSRAGATVVVGLD